ncbi:hypothetical protein OAV88_03070 [bacterium]|nr:hypothetical protein [bacterium]
MRSPNSDIQTYFFVNRLESASWAPSSSERECTTANHRIFIRAAIPQSNIPKYDMCTRIITYFKWG